jgi:hypothetical protein
MNYIEFDDSPFRNSWLLGGYAVLILTPIQEYGYSITTTENETISTNFDKLAMYGVEFTRLNDSR